MAAINGPLTFAPGTYDVKISVANSLVPCTNTPILDSSVTLESGKDVSSVFSPSQTGTPALATFSNNFATVAANTARVLIAHAADAPTVQVTFQNTTTKQNYTYTVNPANC